MIGRDVRVGGGRRTKLARSDRCRSEVPSSSSPQHVSMWCPFEDTRCEGCRCSKCYLCPGCEDDPKHVELPCIYSYTLHLRAEGESLPTEEQEDEVSAVQPSTPISATALFKDPEYAEMGEYFKFVKVIRDSAVQDGVLANDQDIYQYLSEYVKREDYDDMYKQLGHSMVYNPGPYRLRTPVIAKDHKIKHLLCGEDDKDGIKGIITVHSTSRHSFIDIIKDSEDYFFCDTCKFFLFSEIEFMKDRLMEIPSFYPDCNNFYMSATLDEDNFAIVNTSTVKILQVEDDDDDFFDTPDPKRRKLTHE